MRTENDLREAYGYLADNAPTSDVLHLILDRDAPQHRARFGTLRVALVAAVVLALVATTLISQSGQGGNGKHRVAAPRPADYVTHYTFGTASLPGYSLDLLAIHPDGQHYEYLPKHLPAGTPRAENVGVDVFTPTAQQRAALTAYPRVAVGSAVGYFGSLVIPSSNGGEGVSWQLSDGQWAAVVAVKSVSAQTQLPRADLARLATRLAPKTDDHVALVKVGYLPAQLRFDYAAEYVDQGTMLSPDGTVGTGYRTLSFVDRKVPDGAHSTLDISAVIKPNVNLAKATLKDLPSLTGYGPWTKSAVQGHLAWVSPHGVLIQWGAVQIGLASQRTEGDTSTPVLSQQELLKVANSLTVPASVAIGQGYPLSGAIPPSALR